MRFSFLRMDPKLIVFSFVMLLKYALFVDSKKKPAETSRDSTVDPAQGPLINYIDKNFPIIDHDLPYICDKIPWRGKSVNGWNFQYHLLT